MLPNPDSEYSVVLDACVLAPMPLCDTLLRCADEGGLFRALWSRETLNEVQRTLGKFGRSVEQALRRVQTMERVFPNACVDSSHNFADAKEELPDPNDWHIIEAAISAEADAIVTLNLRHFPEPVLARYGISVHSPDSFLKHLYRLNCLRVLDVLDAQARDIQQERVALLQRLALQVPGFAEMVRSGKV